MNVTYVREGKTCVINACTSSENMSSSLKQEAWSIKHQGLKTTGKDLSSSYDKDFFPWFQEQEYFSESFFFTPEYCANILNFSSNYHQLLQFIGEGIEVSNSLPSV